MKPSPSVERADREKGAIWAIDLLKQGTPPELHLIVVDASTRTKVLGEPVQNSPKFTGYSNTRSKELARRRKSRPTEARNISVTPFNNCWERLACGTSCARIRLPQVPLSVS